MPDSTFAQFGSQKCISLETFKKDGVLKMIGNWLPTVSPRVRAMVRIQPA